MKIEITSTDKITTIDNVPVRVWEGKTERGIKCFVFVHRIAVDKDENAEEFEKELQKMLPPGVPISFCCWTYDDFYECWNTGCGEKFCIITGTPAENKMRFCPYCGKRISGQTNGIENPELLKDNQ